MTSSRKSSVSTMMSLGAAAVALVPVMVRRQDASWEAAGGSPRAKNTQVEIIVTDTLIRGQAPVAANLINPGVGRIQETAATFANQSLASVPQVSNCFPTADLAIAVNQFLPGAPGHLAASSQLHGRHTRIENLGRERAVVK